MKSMKYQTTISPYFEGYLAVATCVFTESGISYIQIMHIYTNIYFVMLLKLLDFHALLITYKYFLSIQFVMILDYSVANVFLVLAYLLLSIFSIIFSLLSNGILFIVSSCYLLFSWLLRIPNECVIWLSSYPFKLRIPS